MSDRREQLRRAAADLAEQLYELLREELLATGAQVRVVVDACWETGVPLAHGGRGGSESLRGAFVELEGRLGSARPE